MAVSGAGCSDKSEQHARAQPGTNVVMLIEPNLGVGNVRAGMTVTQIIAELGEPQRRTANSLEYTGLGLAVLPGPDGVVQVVMCGDVTGINGPFTKAFKGRTREGLGMYSSREEIVKALGQPSERQQLRGGLESLNYEDAGITFTLEGGKTHHMIVRLRGNTPPGAPVTLEPGKQ
jgi:hypothetical protein